MNRAQRRKLKKEKPDRTANLKRFVPIEPKQAPENADFSSVPLATMCQSIQLLINELYQRGYPMYDFDNKGKFIQGIHIIQGKVFFLAAEEDTGNEKV